MEARQGERVTPPDQTNLRVQVAGPDVAPRGRHGLVAQEEGPVGELVLDDAHAPRFGEHDAGFVVVAPHEPEFDRSAAPEVGDVLDQRGGNAGRVVHEIAQHDDAASVGAIERRLEPPEIAAEGAVGQGDAVRPEGLGLAPVQIGDEQRRARRPEDGALGEQRERFARHVHGDRGAGRRAAAFGAPACRLALGFSAPAYRRA